MATSTLKVGVVAQTIPALGGGLGFFLIRAISELANARPGWQFEIVALSSFPELARVNPNNIRVHWCDTRRDQQVITRVISPFFPVERRKRIPSALMIRAEKISTAWQNHIAEVCSGLQVDLIWAPNYYLNSNSLSLHQNLRGDRTPILFTIHDIHAVFYPNDWPAESLGRFWLEMVPFAQRSQLIITHTHFQRDCIVEHMQISPEKVDVVPIAPLIEPHILTQSFTSQQVTSTLAGFGIQPPFVLYPGSTSHAHKNHVRLLIAWAELRIRLGSACPMLVCTAKGHRWPELKSLIEALQLQDKVVFTDTIDTARLALLIQNSALVVVPTLYEGGGSGPVTDACLAGKPVVCSQIPPIEEHLNYLGYEQPQFFDPLSVLSIVQAVQEALHRLPQLEEKARTNQQRVLARLPSLWSEWSHQYISCMQRVAGIASD